MDWTFQETGPYRRKLRTRTKNQKPESPEKAEEEPEEEPEDPKKPEKPEKPEKKPAKKAVKRQQPTEKKSTAKSPKSRGPKKKTGQGAPSSEVCTSIINFHNFYVSYYDGIFTEYFFVECSSERSAIRC